MRRWRSVYTFLALIIVLLLVLSGCRGQARAESWPGLIAVDGTIYAADVSRVVALDSETGNPRWFWFPGEREDSRVGFYATPVLDEERNLLLVAGFRNQTVYALKLGEGPLDTPTLVWSFPGAAAAEGARGQYVSNGTLAGDLFFIGNGDGYVYALDVADGSLVWSFPTGDRVWSTPLVVDDAVYVGSLDGNLYALDTQTGRELWRQESRGAIAMSPVLINGNIWYGDFGDQLYEVDPESGQVLWSYEGENWFWATPVVQENVLYFADVQGKVLALNANSHQILWEAQEEAIFRGQGVLSPDGSMLLLPGYERGLVHAFETETGDEIPWGEVSDEARRLPSSLTLQDERLLAMPILTDARVLAFDLDRETLLWQYPSPEGE